MLTQNGSKTAGFVRQAVTKQIREMAQRRGPNAKLPTVAELCLEFGTTKSTVDLALGELETGGIITRRRGSGIYVSPRLHSKRIVVFLEDEVFRGSNASPFWGNLLSLLVEASNGRATNYNENYEFLIVKTHGLPIPSVADHLQRRLIGAPVHAALVVGAEIGHEELPYEIPVVRYASFGDWVVEVRAVDILPMAISALAEQGCQRIAWCVPVSEFSFGYTKGESEPSDVRGSHVEFGRMLAPYGLVCDENLVHTSLMVRDYDAGRFKIPPGAQQQGYDTVVRMFQSRDTAPDGMIFMDDMMTSGALVALEHLGIRLGKDVHLCSHSNAGSPILFGRESDLIRIEVDTPGIVREMFGLLDALLYEGLKTPKKVILPPRLLPITPRSYAERL